MGVLRFMVKDGSNQCIPVKTFQTTADEVSVSQRLTVSRDYLLNTGNIFICVECFAAPQYSSCPE